MAFSAARLTANFAARSTRFCSRLISANFAMISVPEREFKGGEQSFGFVIGLSGCRDADIHTAQRVNLVVFDFRENDLFLDTDVVVTTTIKCTAVHTTEIAYARQSHGNEAIQELVHASAAQGDHRTDRVTFTDFEACDRFAGLGGHWLLAGDLGQVSNCVLENFFIRDSLTNTHVQGDLGQAWNFHYRLVTKLAGQVGNDFFFIEFLETCHDFLSLHYFAGGFKDANFLAVHFFETHAICLASRCIKQCNVGHVNWHGLIDDTTSYASHRVWLSSFFSDVNAVNHDMFSIDTLLYHTTFALVFPGQNDDFVVFTNLIHYDSLQDFRCQGHDFHELLSTQFACDRSKNTGTDRFQLGVQQNGGIAVELHQGTVLAANTFSGAHNHGVINFTFFDTATWRSNLNGYLDHIANASITALGAAQYIDAHYFFGTGIVSHFEPAFSLNHSILFPNLSRRIHTMWTHGQSWSRQPPGRVAVWVDDFPKPLTFTTAAD